MASLIPLLLPWLIVSVALVTGCASSGPIGSRQVVTEDAYRSADEVVERIPEAFTALPVERLAAQKERPVKVYRGILLVDDGGTMRERGPAPFGSRAALAEVLAARLRSSLGRRTRSGLPTTEPFALEQRTVRQLTGWRSRLFDAILALEPELMGPERKTLIIFSRADRVDEAVVRRIHALQARLGEGLCVHLVTVGDRSACFKLQDLQYCGTAATGAEIATPEAMAAFALRVFYGQPPDTDGDGVPNYKDRCPRTAHGLRVNWDGCPFDEARLLRLLPSEIHRAGATLPPPSSL